MSLYACLLSALLVAGISAQFEDFARNVVKTLSVTNGADTGTWRREEFCPMGTYATGYQLKYEEPVVFDDSGVNGIVLTCEPRDVNDLTYYGYADSHHGPWGDWMVPLACSSPDETQRYFLTTFLLRVEPDGTFGYRGVTNIAMWCAEFEAQEFGYSLEGNGGDDGEWGSWSEQCGNGAAVCGVSVQFEEPNYVDETAVNDIVFFCCDD